MSKKEKIGIGCLIGVLLVVFAVALAQDVMPKVRLRIAMHSPRDITKVRMVFKRGTLTPKGATIIVDDSNDYHFSYYPDHYSLQKRENDEWKEAKHVEYEEDIIQLLYDTKYIVYQAKKIQSKWN